jgi:hypothetical protein
MAIKLNTNPVFLDPELAEILQYERNIGGGTNLAGQQTPYGSSANQPQPGSYGFYTPDFSYGSYQIPYEDPTYRSGFEYARTIAGGMPFEDVVAPGMSFSPDQPMGYTQADLRKKEIYGDFDGVMPVAPTKGTPFAPNEGFVQMPSAPQGVSGPTRILPDKTEITGIPDYLKGLDFSSLQDLDFSNLPGVKTQEVIEPQQDFFKVDQNLFNFEQIADKIDMDEVAKIDIEKIDIPESVSLFSDILKEPVSKGPVSKGPVLPSIFDEPTAPVMPTMPMQPMVQPIKAPVIPTQTLPQNIFANIPNFSKIPGLPNIPVVPEPIQTMPVIPQIPLMPQIPQIAYTPQVPSFVQPNIDEIVRPISRQGKFLTQQPGLFNLA